MVQMVNFKEKISQLKVLILGDVMLDHYLHGTVDRISPEAPVPVVALQKTEYRLGGAANVALNIQAMGAKALLCGVIGKDASATIFMDKMQANELNTDWIFSSSERPTTRKSRILANHQQLLRIDDEATHPLSTQEEGIALTQLEQLLAQEQPDVILFQDYNKGMLTPGLISTVIQWAKEKNIPTVVDPKFSNFMAFKNVDLFKPNLKELREGLGKKVDVERDALTKAAEELTQAIQPKAILITLSQHGIFSYQNGQGKIIPTYPREIVDVCGAGDAVISVCALALAIGMELTTIAQMSNLAGGMVCESLGVVPIPFEAFLEEMKSLSLLNTLNTN